MRWIDRLTGTSGTNPATESEQAFIRLGLGVISSLYIWFVSGPSATLGPTGHFSLSPRSAILPYIVFALLILLSIRKSPEPNTIRKLLVIVADLAAASFVMSESGKQGLPLTIFYLWVIMGNGFRYGTRYLLFAIPVAATGLLWVYYRNLYWRNHPILFWSQLAGIVILPLYMVVLLDKLKKTIEIANEANRAKSRFLANMSHELRTPLNGIIGMGDLLLETQITTKQKTLLDTLQMSARNLSEIIEKILDFSKGEAGRLTARSLRFDFYQALEEAIATIRPLAQKKTIPIKVFWDTRIPRHTNGDPHNLRRILVNLLGNAIKFTDTGEIVLSITSLHLERETILIRFDVTDTGIGIPETLKERVFDSFAQGDDSVTKRFGGTGLGLSISKQLVELMNGKIGFWSLEGKGSTFWCEIPFSLPPGGLPAEETSGMPTPTVLFWSRRESPEEILPGFVKNPVLIHHLPDTDTLLPKTGESGASGTPPCIFLATVDIHNIKRLKKVFSNPANEPFLTNALKLLIPLDGVDPSSLKSLSSGGDYAILPHPPDPIQIARALEIWRSLSPTLTAYLRQEEAVLPDTSLRKGLSILVAEDHPVNQKVIRGILESRGHIVHLVEDGDQALDLLGEEQVPFDLMILDLCMPVMGGIDVLNAYHFMERNAPIPAIILTANATEEAIESSRTARARAFLTKPLDASRLLDEVQRVFLDQSARASAKLERMEGEKGQALLVNRSILQELREYSRDPGFLRDLLDGFLSEGKKLLGEMDNALSRHDFLMFMDAVHALKGSALQIGGVQLASQCREAESVGFQEILSGQASPAGEALKETFDRTVQELESMLNDIQGISPKTQGS